MRFALVESYNPETYQPQYKRRKVRCKCTDGKSMTMQSNYEKRFTFFSITDLKDNIELCPICEYFYYYKI